MEFQAWQNLAFSPMRTWLLQTPPSRHGIARRINESKKIDRFCGRSIFSPLSLPLFRSRSSCVVLDQSLHFSEAFAHRRPARFGIFESVSDFKIPDGYQSKCSFGFSRAKASARLR